MAKSKHKTSCAKEDCTLAENMNTRRNSMKDLLGVDNCSPNLVQLSTNTSLGVLGVLLAPDVESCLGE
jgi:hypothetical protein